MTPSEISETVFREKNSITAVLNTMERQGVVHREPSTNDRRSVKVVITDKGWKEANRLSPIAQELSREELSNGERNQDSRKGRAGSCSGGENAGKRFRSGREIGGQRPDVRFRKARRAGGGFYPHR